MLRKLLLLLTTPLLVGCFPYVYDRQDRVLIKGIEIGPTLEIARSELGEGGFDATLAIWAIRDQVFSADNARTISALYFTYIDTVAAEKRSTTAAFGVWHFTWAISNLYRNGDDSVRHVLENAFIDALQRPEKLRHFKGAAVAHVKGPRMVMGDIHWAARAFARAHIVAPGNEKYLQSLDEYTLANAKAKAKAEAKAKAKAKAKN